MDVDALAQEIRRVDGSNSLGAGALAEALMPFLSRSTLPREGQGGENKLRRMAFEDILNFKPDPSSEKSAFEQIATHARATVMEAQTAISALSPSPAVRDGVGLTGAVKGEGFEPNEGGFAHIWVGDKKFSVDTVRRALSTQEQGNG